MKNPPPKKDLRRVDQQCQHKHAYKGRKPQISIGTTEIHIKDKGGQGPLLISPIFFFFKISGECKPFLKTSLLLYLILYYCLFFIIIIISILPYSSSGGQCFQQKTARLPLMVTTSWLRLDLASLHLFIDLFCYPGDCLLWLWKNKNLSYR